MTLYPASSPATETSAQDDSATPVASCVPVDGPPEGEEFDDLVRIAAQLLGVPMAMIGVMEAEHLRMVAEYGCAKRLIPRERAISRAVDHASPLLFLSDAASDARFRHDPSVCEDGVRFFLGMALFGSGGAQLGVLCVADREPRDSLPQEQLTLLRRLARLAARMLERRTLERSRRVAEQIAQTTFSAVVMLDARGSVASMNEAAQALFGSTVTIGQSVQMLFPSVLQTDPEAVAAWLQASVDEVTDHRGHQERADRNPHASGSNAGAMDTCELRMQSAGRETRTLQAVRCALPGQDRTAALLLRDITDNHRLQQSLAQPSRQDPLTDTSSRAVLLDTVAQLVGSDQPLVVALLGLDNFRALNDVLGPTIGDTALQIIACRLLARMPADAHVARFGGDEFAMVFPAAPDNEVESSLQTILRDIARPCEIDHHRVHLEASIGIARYDAADLAGACGHADASELLACAGLALRHAKRAGGQQQRWFEPGMRTAAIDRRQLDLELRRACQEGEFELHYQPQIDLVSGRPTGAEALLRWRHPERGLLYPAAFIDALSHSVVAPEVGRWIIQRACGDAAAWPVVQGRRLAVGINLFPVQFYDGQLLEEIDRVLALTGLDPAQVELELTETIALRNDGVAEQLLTQLRARGVRVSFDDFGTGFASLSMLHRLPIDRIKIDHSFVQNVLENRGDKAIVRSIALMARNFDLQVIAEGVETALQAAFLREIGCDEVQGFLYSKALASMDFHRWLDRHLTGGDQVDA